MGNSYIRQSSAEIIDGETVYAGPLNAEFNAIQNFADGVSGHTHDGTVGEGPKINLNTSIVGVLPVANGGIGGINKLNATVAPTANDDINDGYAVGSLWVNISNNTYYICVDSTVGAAVWIWSIAYNAALVSIGALTTSANQMIYTTAPDVYATTSLTPFGRTILDDVDATSVRTTIGLGSIATQDSNSVSITGGSLSGITVNTPTISGGTFSNPNINSPTITNVNITSGTITGITDLAIADGGTGASTVTGAKTNLNLNNVDNTSDLNKPISTATQTALNNKSNVGHTHIPSDIIGLEASLDPWALQPIGVLIPANMGVTGFVAPPKDRAYRYVLLTAGQTGAGAYNQGILTSESLSGSSPVVSSTGVISLSGSIFNGSTIRLINTERRFIRAGSAGTLEDSQNASHTHGVNDPGHAHAFNGLITGQQGQNGSNGQSFILNETLATTTSATGISIQSNGGNEARSRNIGVEYYMRIL